MEAEERRAGGCGVDARTLIGETIRQKGAPAWCDITRQVGRREEEDEDGHTHEPRARDPHGVGNELPLRVGPNVSGRRRVSPWSRRGLDSRRASALSAFSGRGGGGEEEDAELQTSGVPRGESSTHGARRAATARARQNFHGTLTSASASWSRRPPRPAGPCHRLARSRPRCRSARRSGPSRPCTPSSRP